MKNWKQTNESRLGYVNVQMIEMGSVNNRRQTMTTTDIKTACVGETQMALYHKALGERGEEIREALHSGNGCDGVTIVDDQSDRPWNQECTICVIADVTCDDGVQRIAYYHDGALDVLDDGDGMDSCEDWAKAWDDVDGLVPAYLGISEDDDNG